MLNSQRYHNKQRIYPRLCKNLGTVAAYDGTTRKVKSYLYFFTFYILHLVSVQRSCFDRFTLVFLEDSSDLLAASLMEIIRLFPNLILRSVVDVLTC